MDKGIARALFRGGMIFSCAFTVELVALLAPVRATVVLLGICGILAALCFLFLAVGLVLDWYQRLPDDDDY